MDSLGLIIGIAFALLVLVGVLVALVRRRPVPPAAPRPGIDYAPGVGDDDTVPRDTPRRSIAEAVSVDTVSVDTVPEAPLDEIVLEEVDLQEFRLEQPEPAAGRLTRLRRRLARSQSAFGRGLLSLMSRDTVDAATWDEIEETLLTADLGVSASVELIERLRARVLAEAPSSPEAVRALLREELPRRGIDPGSDLELLALATPEGDGRGQGHRISPCSPAGVACGSESRRRTSGSVPDHR